MPTSLTKDIGLQTTRAAEAMRVSEGANDGTTEEPEEAVCVDAGEGRGRAEHGYPAGEGGA